MRLSLLTRLLVLAGGVSLGAAPCIARESAGIRSVDFRNFTYFANGTQFVLLDGKYYEGESGSWHSYALMPVKYVDFDRDGHDEAFVVVDYRSSGTFDHGQEYFVFAYRNGAAQVIFHESSEKPFDARASHQRIVISSPFWKDGGACCPSGVETTVYLYRNGRFIRASTKRRDVNGPPNWWLHPHRA